MKEIFNGISRNKKNTVQILGCLLLLSFSATILFSGTENGQLHEKIHNGLWWSLGGVMGVVGLVLGLFLVKRGYERYEEHRPRDGSWKKNLLFFFLAYLAVLLLLAVINGLLSMAFYGFEILSYEETKQIIYFLTLMEQQVLRILWIFLVIEDMKCRPLGKNKRRVLIPCLIGVLLSTVPILLSYLAIAWLFGLLTGLWSALFLLGYILYFSYGSKEEVPDEV